MTINAGVPQGSVLSATLFLLHINDLLKPNMFGYADDTTVVERYLSNAQASQIITKSERQAMVTRMNSALQDVASWGDANLVEFNAKKTQACFFTAKRTSLHLTPYFCGVPISLNNSLDLLGVSISANLNFGQFIESKAQVAAKKLGILAKVRHYFTPEQLHELYQAQVRSCVEYSSHLWAGSAKTHLGALDSIERRACRIIADPSLIRSKLQSLDHRRQVACLSVFYKIHFGECAYELHHLIPPSPFFYRTSRRGMELHPFTVDIPHKRTQRYANSFFIRTAKEWNSLPSSVFPDHYNLQLFKSRVNRLLLGRRAPT
ncbi:uncharacterized protein LOC123690909 [Colias croceus]|uniref:uncharacterized protein LOC123690909 n=1 Tax=Colias crocea TaxID=72248 RepID=UPI001E27DD5E|nr:uncharacterized protein LOC123690909 [Colias croceus]